MTVTIMKDFGYISLGYSTDEVVVWSTEGVSGGTDATFMNYETGGTLRSFGSRIVTSNFDEGGVLVATTTGAGQGLAYQVGWQKLWDTNNINGGADGACYLPIAPPDFVAMGVVFTSGGEPDPAFYVWCVHNSMVAEIQEKSVIWNTAGISGGSDLSLYQGVVRQDGASFYSQDTNPNLKIPVSTVCTQSTYMLLLPTPFTVPSTPANPPLLSSFTSPGDTTDWMPDGQVTLPYILVVDDGKDRKWQVANSPFYTLSRDSNFSNVVFSYNQGELPSDPSYSLTTGITKEASTTFSHSAGIEIGAEGGVEFLGTGGKVSLKVNYQFGYSNTNSTSEMTSSTKAIVVHVPGRHAGIIWSLTRRFTFARSNGDQIGNPLVYATGSTVTDQFPAAADSGHSVTYQTVT